MTELFTVIKQEPELIIDEFDQPFEITFPAEQKIDGYKLFECDICNQSFLQLTSIRTHMKIHIEHNGYEASPIFKCPMRVSNNVIPGTIIKNQHTTEKPHDIVKSVEEVTRKIRENVFTTRTNIVSKSEVWKTFSEVLTENGVKIGFVSCNFCKKILTKNRRSSSNLLSHPCAKKAKIGSKVEISLDTKISITNACVKWSIENCASFSNMDGVGLEQLLIEVLRVGATYGAAVNIKNLLPHRSKVSEGISKLYNDHLPEIKHELSTIKFGAITTNFWTDIYKKWTYLSMTVHFVKGFKNINRLLAVKYFDYDQQTGVNIFDQIQSFFREYNLNIENFVFVTDQGTHINSALENCTRLTCAAHLLNNILTAAFAEVKDFNVLCVKSMALLKYLKKTPSFQQTLKSTVKTDYATRWNNKLQMFESISQNWNEMIQVLNRKNELNKLRGIHLLEVNEIIEFLTIFGKATTELQKSSSPTLHLCLPHYIHLSTQCETRNGDSHLIQKLKHSCAKYLLTLWKPEIKVQHLASTFLFPLCKKLIVSSVAEIEAAHTFVEETYEKLVAGGIDTNQKPAVNVHAPEPLRPRSIFSVFDEQEDLPVNDEQNIRVEIMRYLAEPRADIDDIHKYWAARENVFPKLALVYKALSAIPATSTDLERGYLANNVISAERSSNDSDEANKLLVLNSHFKIVNQK